MADSGQQEANLYEELCAAVHTMFQGHDAREQRKANDFLVSFRRSERAWDLCLLIVSQDGYSSYELAMFASQTLVQLARKSKDSWEERWQEGVYCLLELALRSGTPSLATQLSLAACSLFIRFVPLAEAAQALQAVNEHLSALDIASDIQCLQLWLLFLSLLPEEMVNRRVAAKPQRRDQLQRLLRTEYGPTLCESLLQYLTSYEGTLAPCCSTLRAWICHIGLEWRLISGLVSSTYQALTMRAQNPPSDGNSDWQALTDLLTSVMESYSSVEVLGLFLSELPTLPNLHAHQDLTQLLVVACSQSLHLLDSAELQDVWPGALGVLIQCTSSQDLDSASTAMDFWQVLVDKLSVQKADQLAELMEAIFTTVMHACGYPEGYVRASQEWRDDFMDFRETARMVLRSIGITWSGSARWLAFSAASRLEELLATDASNVAEAECVVHALSACSRKLFPAIRTSDDPGDDVQMAVLRCCQCLPQLSPHPALQRTLVLLLGVIWPWLSQHPAQLQAGFETVLNSLQIPEEDPLYPMRLMEDHVGCVALVKLARAPDSGAIFYAVFEAWQLQETRPTMTHASRQLLLESTASCALHAGGDEIFHVLNATCERATALLNICDGEGLMAWSKASLVEGLVLVLQEVAIVAKKTHGPELTHVFSELFSLDASPSFVVRLLLGTRAQPLCPVAEVTEALRDLALAALSDDDAETEQLTVSVGNVFWQHFQLKNDSAASINVFQGCIEAGGHRYARVVEQYNTIVPAVLTGIDLSAMLAGDEPNPVLAEAFFNLLSACCEHTPGILIPYTQHLTETVLCETLTFSCVALLSSASVCRSIFGLIGAMAARHDSRGCLLDHALQHNATVGPSLTCGLLTGVSELFPSFLLEDAVACFRLLLGSYGIPTVCQWLAAAINRPDFPRVSVSSTAKQQFLDDVAKASSLKGMSRLKNTIKTFCGGKKKGTTGTPSNTDVSPAMLRKQVSHPTPVRFGVQDTLLDVPVHVSRSHSV